MLIRVNVNWNTYNLEWKNISLVKTFLSRGNANYNICHLEQMSIRWKPKEQ